MTSIAGDSDQTPPSRHCHLWNDGQCRWAGAVFATSANNAVGSTPKSTAPISLTLGSTLALPPQLGFVSMLIVSKFWIEMCNHPDRVVVSYVVEGLKHGFQIGFSLFMLTQICLYKYAVCDSVAFSDNYLQSEIASW